VFACLAMTLLLLVDAGVCPASNREISRVQGNESAKKSSKSGTSKACMSHKKASESAALDARFDELIAKATKSESVLIIAGLCVEFVPEGKLTPTAVKAQRQAIAKAQDDLLSKLRPFSVSSIKRYEFIPYVAMSVDLATLKFLKNKRMLASIEEDQPTPLAN
jgi:AICAR transformylase/IMP cyclohydrolase PurH